MLLNNPKLSAWLVEERQALMYEDRWAIMLAHVARATRCAGVPRLRSLSASARLRAWLATSQQSMLAVVRSRWIYPRGTAQCTAGIAVAAHGTMSARGAVAAHCVAAAPSSCTDR